jgi:hypothetical protein
MSPTFQQVVDDFEARKHRVRSELQAIDTILRKLLQKVEALEKTLP